MGCNGFISFTSNSIRGKRNFFFCFFLGNQTVTSVDCRSVEVSKFVRPKQGGFGLTINVIECAFWILNESLVLGLD